MVTLSLCMIVRDEANVLARCLDSVGAAADEIIIVDTGSEDSTKEIAARYTTKVFDFVWVDDFSAARNFAFDQATMDYQMWLDADDVLEGNALAQLLALKESLDPNIDIVTMKYHTHFDAHGHPVLTSTRERLMKRSKGYRWIDPIHECIPLTGRMLQSDIAICHRKPPREGISTRNLDIYRALEARGAVMTPRQQYYFARELKDHGHYERAARYFRLFLDGGQGWEEDNIAACHSLAACLTSLGEEEAAFSTLLDSFRFDAPRAEVCCELGYYHMRQGRYLVALGWFETAAALPRRDSLGFFQERYWGYVPCIEACVCCCRLGRYDQARSYNERAGQCRPDDPSVAHNRQYLEGLAAPTNTYAT